MITTESGESHALPTEVREQATTKTSIYEAGKLIYDGATGEGTGGRGTSGPGASLNEMLKWSIEHADPAELSRRAAEGAKAPSQIDKEILDMILGQPIVAKMRECLGKLESEALSSDGGLDDGAAALEELEYYAEDLDNALDLAKIGGLAAMRRCCAFGLLGDDPEASPSAAAEAAAVAGAGEEAAALREAACGVLAAMVQNNPKVAAAAYAVGIPQLLLALLAGGGAGAEAERVGGIAVVRKALLALSALLRTEEAPPDVSDGASSQRTLAAAAAAAAADADKAQAGSEKSGQQALAISLPTLCVLAAHDDLKVRRRALFLLASLAVDGAADTIAAAADAPLLRALLDNLSGDDEDVRTQSARLLLAISGEGGTPTGARAGVVGRLQAAGAADACTRALARTAGAAAGSVDPEEEGRLKRLAAHLARAG